MDFELSANKVYCGDCLALMRELPAGSFDAVVTDPPWPDCKIDLGWLGPEWWARVVSELERVVGDKGKIIIHLNSETNPAPFLAPFKVPFVHTCWLRFIPPRYRGNVCNEADMAYQFGYGFLPKGKRVLPQLCDHSPSRGRRFQMLQFPCYRNLGHVQWLIKTQVGPDRRVLDPFTGSGTTGLACLRNGCEFMGFEIVSEVCKAANERIERESVGLLIADLQGQQALFLNKGV